MNKYSLLLSYGVEESNILQKLSHYEALPRNKNEIFRRGLRAVDYLDNINERSLLRTLVIRFRHIDKTDDILDKLPLVIEALQLLLAVLVVKYGANKDQFLENLLQKIVTNEEKLNKFVSEKGERSLLDSKDPFLLKIHEELRILGQAIEKVYGFPEHLS